MKINWKLVEPSLIKYIMTLTIKARCNPISLANASKPENINEEMMIDADKALTDRLLNDKHLVTNFLMIVWEENGDNLTKMEAKC